MLIQIETRVTKGPEYAKRIRSLILKRNIFNFFSPQNYTQFNIIRGPQRDCNKRKVKK